MVGANSYELGQVGPDFLIFRDPTALTPCEGEVVMTIDGREHRWSVSLPEGRTADSRISKTRPPKSRQNGN